MIDGIIKYNLEFNISAPLKKSHISDIEAVRKRLFMLGLVGEANGIGYGNVSQKTDRDLDTFIITGTQTGYLEDLGAEHYSKIDEHSDKRFYLKSSGSIKPSSEALTHATIYNLSPNIGAVIHIHSREIWEFMLERDYLRTAKVEYGSLEMIDEVGRVFQDIDPLSNPKFVMSGHQDGVMFFGRDLKEAEAEVLSVVEVTT